MLTEVEKREKEELEKRMSEDLCRFTELTIKETAEVDCKIIDNEHIEIEGQVMDTEEFNDWLHLNQEKIVNNMMGLNTGSLEKLVKKEFDA